MRWHDREYGLPPNTAWMFYIWQRADKRRFRGKDGENVLFSFVF